MDELRFINARIGRWLFLVLLVAAGLTRHGGGAWHVGLGLALAFVAGARIAEGFIGKSDVRFLTMLHGARGKLLAAVLALSLVTALAGILLTTDGLWSARWLQSLHWAAALLLFVTAAVYGSLYHFVGPRKGDL